MAAENSDMEERAETEGDSGEEEIVPTFEEEIDPFPPSEEEGLDTAPPSEAYDDAVVLSSDEDTTLEEDLGEAVESTQESESEGETLEPVAVHSHEHSHDDDLQDHDHEHSEQTEGSVDLSAQLAMGTGSFWFMAASVVVFLIAIILKAI